MLHGLGSLFGWDSRDDHDPLLLEDTTKKGKAMVDKVEVAAVWIDKARSGSLQWVDECSRSQMQAYRFKKKLKPVSQLLKYLLLAVAIFERPSWCLTSLDSCPGPDHPELYGSGAPVLPPNVTNWIAISLWTYFGFVLLLRRKALGEAHKLSNFQLIGVCAHAIAFVDCIVSIFNVTGIFPGTFRISRLLRPFIYLFYTRAIREAGWRVISSIPGFLDALLALFFTVALFSWFGLVLFVETAEGTSFFASWHDAISSMWILFTTANSPDVYIPVYNRHRGAFIFFFIYTVLTLYLISNVLLAFVFDTYKMKLKEHVKRFFTNQAIATNRAFALLQSENGYITSETWRAFFNAYFQHHYHAWDQSTGNSIADQVFRALDKDHSNGLDEKEFRTVTKVLMDSETFISPGVAKEAQQERKKSNWWAWRKWLRKSCFPVNGRPLFPWDDIMDGVIFMGVVLTFVQTFFFLESGGKSDIFLATYKIMAAFSAFYIAELTIKIIIVGPSRYWFTRVFFHRIDFFNVYGLCAVEIFNLVTLGSYPVTIRIAILLHITRSLRVLRHIEALNFITSVIIRLVPAYWRMSMLLMLVFYTYATIGVEVFGGDVYQGHPLLKGSDYEASNYWAFNFNDFNSGMVTLFVLMVGNNWHVFAGAVMTVTSPWSAIFFVSFAVITNLIVLNILMALILECSQSMREELERDDDDEGEEEGEAAPERDEALYSYEAMIRKVLLDSDDLAEIEREVDQSPKTSSEQRRVGYGSV